MKKDIEDRSDIVLLINSFYERVQVNDKIGYIFTEIAKVDWEKHLPRMYSFWESILLEDRGYSGNPMSVHIALSKIVHLRESEFDEWVILFTSTVDRLFEGPKAIDAKTRATNIARLMLHKIKTA